MSKNFEVYLKLNKAKYRNRYVVIVDGKVFGDTEGEGIVDLLARARKEYPKEVPLVAKIPDERMLIL